MPLGQAAKKSILLGFLGLGGGVSRFGCRLFLRGFLGGGFFRLATTGAPLDLGLRCGEHGFRAVLQSGDFLQVIRLNAIQGIQREEAGVHDGIGLGLLDTGDRGECIDGFGDLFLKPDFDFLFGVDVDLPSGEDAGEACVCLLYTSDAADE